MRDRNTNRLIFIGAIVFFLLGGESVAAESPEFAALVQRVEKLEKENATLKQELSDVREEIVVLRSETESVSVAVDKPKKSIVVTSKPPVKIQMYGFVKADGIWNDSQIGELSFAAPVESGANGADNQEFTMNLRDSRIGFDFEGPPIGKDGIVKGKIEADFYGDTLSDDDASPDFRLRQAYVDLVFPEWDFLAGQTWAFFAPLNPDTLMFQVLWRQGNLGDRHPQFILSRRFEDVLGGQLKLRLGAVEGATSLESLDGLPHLGGWAQYDTEFLGMPLMLGLGGLYGEQDLATTISTNTDVWAGTAGFKLRFNDLFSLVGEGYTGAGLAPFRAGSPTAVRTGDGTGTSVRTTGGWVQLTYQHSPTLKFNLGTGIDDVQTDGTGTATIWDYNYTYYANFKHKLTASVWWGMEYQRLITKYTQQAGGDGNRVMSSIAYVF